MKKRIPLPGSRLHLRDVTSVGRPEGRLTITLHLRRSQPHARSLAELLDEAVISPQQRCRTTGASESDIAAIRAFAAEAGLEVVGVDAGQRLVRLQGSIAEMEEALQIEFHTCSHPLHSRHFRAHSGRPALPEDLHEIVVGVSGLTDRPIFRPMVKAGAGDSALTMYPQEVAEAYGFPDGTGKGQSVAIIQLGGGYTDAGLDSYFKQAGLPRPTVVSREIAGKTNSPDEAESSEVYLDVCIVGAIVPEATIVVYFAPDFTSAIQAAINDAEYDHSVISISWGGQERYYAEGDGTLHPDTLAIEAALQDAMVAGIPVFIASGDSGSGNIFGDAPRTTRLTEVASVSYPASSAYALACGGSRMTRTESGGVASEVVWNSLKITATNKSGDSVPGGATGGGVSALWGVPVYQMSAGLTPQTVNAAAPQDRQVMRGLPDVGGNADSDTGYLVYDHKSGDITNYGGTSAVAPLWAALVVRLNEHLVPSRVGRLHGLLYKQGAQICRPISSGDNNSSPPVGGYAAAEGWNMCNGWGSPDGAKLLAALKAAITR